MCSSSNQGQQDPGTAVQGSAVEGQDHLPQAVHVAREACTGVCRDSLVPIPGGGQRDLGEGPEEDGQHDTRNEGELRGQAEGPGDDNPAEKKGEGRHDTDVEDPDWQG